MRRNRNLDLQLQQKADTVFLYKNRIREVMIEARASTVISAAGSAVCREFLHKTEQIRGCLADWLE